MIATAVRRSALLVLVVWAVLLVLPAGSAAAWNSDTDGDGICDDTDTVAPDETVTDGGGTSPGSVGSLSTADTPTVDPVEGCAVPDYGGVGYEGEGGGSGEYAGEPVPTGGAGTPEVAGAADEACPGGGASAGDSEEGVYPAPRPDSDTADVDSSAAEPSEGTAVSGLGVAGMSAAAGGEPCVTAIGDVDGDENSIDTPTRIDAGAGGAAAQSGAGGLLGAAAALTALVLEGVRRRWR